MHILFCKWFKLQWLTRFSVQWKTCTKKKVFDLFGWITDFILDNAFKLRFKTGYVNKHDYSFSYDGIDSFWND